MSRLIFKGDIVSNTGEYLPTPYIERIYLYGDDSSGYYEIKTSIFLSNADDRVVNSDNGIVEDEDAYKTIASDLHYYVMVLHNLDDTGFYEEIIDGNLNPLVLYNASGSAYTYDGDPESTDNYEGTYGYTNMSLFEVEPMANDALKLYDEDGNEILKYTVSATSEILSNILGTDVVSWDDVGSMRILAFSSIYGYETFEVENVSDIPIFNINLSDISYESIFENGTLASKNQEEYVDSDGAIFNGIPLISIDSIPYKINRITHEEIVEKFEELLDEYSSFSKKKKGYRPLKKMMDNISYVLEAYKDKADLLPQLNLLRRAFSIKSTAQPVGKLYKSFRRRIVNINKIVKNSEKLQRKILYNSKIIDIRSISLDDDDSTYDSRWESSNRDYLYADWAVSKMTLDSANAPDDGTLQVVFGHFFFDYEKALRQTSDISQIFNVGKLESLGFYIPYESFAVEYVTVTREDESNGESVVIKGVHDADLSYPLTDYVVVKDNGATSTVIVDPSTELSLYSAAFYEDTHYGGDSSDGYLTSVIYRNYINPTGEELSGIENYRLMCYELLDYQQYSQADVYTVEISINDNTIAMVDSIMATVSSAAEDVKAYYELAEQLCSFNSDLDVFNDFFRDSIAAEYKDDLENAPWVRGPLIYQAYVDLFYNSSSGDIEKITEEVQNISEQIGPASGTLGALSEFKEALSGLLDTVSLTYEAIVGDDEDYASTKTFSVDLYIPNKTSDRIEVDSPLGVAIEPETTRDVLGMSADASAAAAASIEAAEDLQGYVVQNASNLLIPRGG